MGLFLQQNSICDFKSMCADIWAKCVRHFYQKKKSCLIIYSIMVQVAQSGYYQLIEYLSWKDGLKKRRSWQQKSGFMGICRINGGPIR